MLSKKRIRRRYIRNVAKKVIANLRIKATDFECTKRLVVENVARKYGASVKSILSRFSDARVGRIACTGLSYDQGYLPSSRNGNPRFKDWKTPMWHVLEARKYALESNEGGRKLVEKIAVAAIVAEIADIIQGK